MLCPEIGTGACITELHRDARLGAGLANIAFHHVACAKFFAGGAKIYALTKVPGGRTD